LGKLQANPATKQISCSATLSHVQVDCSGGGLAGCDDVMSEIGFSMNLNEILSAYFAANELE